MSKWMCHTIYELPWPWNELYHQGHVLKIAITLFIGGFGFELKKNM